MKATRKYLEGAIERAITDLEFMLAASKNVNFRADAPREQSCPWVIGTMEARGQALLEYLRRAL